MSRPCEAPGCIELLPRDEIDALDWRWLVSVGPKNGGLHAALVCPNCRFEDDWYTAMPENHTLVTQVMFGERVQTYPGTTRVTSKRKACKHVRICYRSRIKGLQAR